MCDKVLWFRKQSEDGFGLEALPWSNLIPHLQRPTLACSSGESRHEALSCSPPAYSGSAMFRAGPLS